MSQKIGVIPGMPDQRIDTTIDGKPITLRLKWNERFGYWFMYIYTRSLEPILGGIKLVPGVWLTGFTQPENYTGDFTLARKTGTSPKPTIDNIGTDFELFYISEDDYLAVKQMEAATSQRSTTL